MYTVNKNITALVATCASTDSPYYDKLDSNNICMYTTYLIYLTIYVSTILVLIVHWFIDDMLYWK